MKNTKFLRFILGIFIILNISTQILAMESRETTNSATKQTTDQANLLESEDNLCTICFDTIKKDNKGIATTTCCNQPVHTKCLMEWAFSPVNTSISCPYCRTPLIEKAMQPANGYLEFFSDRFNRICTYFSINKEILITIQATLLIMMICISIHQDYLIKVITNNGKNILAAYDEILSIWNETFNELKNCTSVVNELKCQVTHLVRTQQDRSSRDFAFSLIKIVFPFLF